MADMITSMVTSFGAPLIEDLGKRIGLPADVVKTAAPLVVAAVIAGVRRLASQPGATNTLTSLYNSANDTVGSDLNSFVNTFDPSQSLSLLNTLTGSNSLENVTANLARVSGVAPDSMGKMLGFLAPAVIAGLGNMAKEKGLDAQGVVDLIDESSDALQAAGNLDYILDDVPGVGDDISRGLKSLFGG
jgi:hypothetical protein